ncbi:ferric enterobactin uptake receptor [Campylobacter hyointestinalis subsp. lawsonii CCUG 27631]|uniref:TonB-dependent ferric enterobactin receptor CfrA n=1 Tax=Campylobacter hyointestinalis TaxID=198 RepID=UPI0007C8B8A8|nr:TonB-dependent receptor [Campylobacter hyointestinalis]ANE35039.1 ferric enterobactin uptake receptor [Campylobacter hyointestinalis subsp. lawsonii CCUG 27631]
MLNSGFITKSASLVLLSSCLFANSDDSYTLDKSVVSASGFAQELKEAPATINVVSKEELQSKPYRDVAEAISDVPGVDLYASKGKTGTYNVTMRGITGYTLILIDGRRQGVGGEIGPNGFSEVSGALLPPLSSIERIEVIKGPMSTLYGSEALGGVINIITKKVSDTWSTSFSFDTLLQENSDWGNTYGQSIFLNGPLVENRLGANFRLRNSYREASSVAYSTPDGKNVDATQAQSPTKANNYDIGAKFNYIIDDKNSLIYDIDYSKNHYNNSKSQLGTLTTSGKTPGSLTGGYSDKMDITKLVTYLTHEGNYDDFTLSSTLQYNRVTNNGREVVGQKTQAYLGENREIKAEDFIADTKAVFQIYDSNVISTGAEYRLEKMHDKIANPTSFDQYALAVYIEDEISFRENLLLTLGGRYNYHEKFGNNISPRAYLVYMPTDEVVLKGGVSTGFKAPYANRLIAGEYNFSGQGTIPVYGNPNLKEETSINYELGANYDNGIVNAGVTGFVTTFKDKISSRNYKKNDEIPSIGSCSADRGCYQAINLGEVEYKGLETSLGLKPIKDLNLDFAWTYLDTKTKESDVASEVGKPVSGSLKHNLSAKASYKYRKFTPWIKGEFQKDRYMGNTNINREYYKDIFLASLGLRYDVNKNWNLNFAVYNLFDKDFTDSFESYKNGATTSWVNTYNRIEEGRRYYLQITGNF